MIAFRFACCAAMFISTQFFFSCHTATSKNFFLPFVPWKLVELNNTLLFHSFAVCCGGRTSIHQELLNFVLFSKVVNRKLEATKLLFQTLTRIIVLVLNIENESNIAILHCLFNSSSSSGKHVVIISKLCKSNYNSYLNFVTQFNFIKHRQIWYWNIFIYLLY